VNDFVTLNRELLDIAATRSGGYTKTQLASIGVPWPPPKHWKRSATGRRISREAFDGLMTARHGSARSVDR
jgi:hypothetical protein